MYLVTGATGFVGRNLVAQLLARGYRVRCLIAEHKLNALPWETPPEIVVGHVLDEEALFRAATGVYAIIHLESAQWWGRPRDLERVELAGTRNLIAAARAARVGRIITVSHLGATPAAAYVLHRVKGLVEEAIRNSGLAYTIIRSGIVFGEDDAFVNHIALMLRANPLIFVMPGRGEVVLHPIYVGDLVQALINALEREDTVDTLLEIGGPEYITLEDLIRTVMRVSGMPRVIVPMPPYILRWSSWLYSRILPRSLMTPQWLDVLATNRTAPLGNAYQYFGIRPRRLEDTLFIYMRRRHYWSLLARSVMRRRPRSV